MSNFSPAKSMNPYRKLAVFGYAGVGKSLIGLSGPGRKKVIDTEGGTIPYAGLLDFDVIHTQDFGEIKKELDDMSINPPKEETTLVLDSASIIWSGLQQTLLEKKLKKAGIAIKDGTEQVAFALADWGLLKKFHNDLMSTIMSLKCHVICTYREAEIMDESGFKSTGVFKPQWEKNSPYAFDFVGRVHNRKFTFTKGRMVKDGKILDITGKVVSLPNVESGADLAKLWISLFGDATYKANGSAPSNKETDPDILDKEPEALKLSREIRSKHLPRCQISNEDLELYLCNKKPDGSDEPLLKRGEDGQCHLSTMEAKRLRWVISKLEDDNGKALIAKIEELKKAGVK